MRLCLVPGGLTAVVAIVALPASASGAPTRADYIAQADPICQSTMAAERQAIGPKGNIQRLLKRGRFKAAARHLRNEFRAFGPGVEQLATLTPPAEDAQLIGSWVQVLRAQVPLGLRAARALGGGHIPVKLFNRLGTLNRNTQALVGSYGFHSCQDL